MTLKEEILQSSRSKKNSDEKSMYTNVIKAFAEDYLNDENVLEDYVELFGESTRPLFDYLAQNKKQLNEFVINYEGNLFEASKENIKEFYLKEDDMSDKWNKSSKNYNTAAKGTNIQKFGALTTTDNQTPSKVAKSTSPDDERSLYQNIKPTNNTSDEIRKAAGVGVGSQRSTTGSYEQNGQGKDISTERNADKSEQGAYQRDTAYDRQHDKEETSNQSSWDKGVKHDKHDKHDTSTWDKGNKHDTAADNSTGSHGAKAMGIDDTTATDVPVKKTGLLDTVMAKTGKSQGFLAGLWDKIKHFGGGIKAYLTGHPGLATGLKIAGGVGALAIALRAAHKAKLERQQQRRA